jgi:hypothetical protein
VRVAFASRVPWSSAAFSALTLVACGGETTAQSGSLGGRGGATGAESAQGGAPSGGNAPAVVGGSVFTGGQSTSGGTTSGGEGTVTGGLDAGGGMPIGGRTLSSGGVNATGGAPASGGFSAAGGTAGCTSWYGRTVEVERVPVVLEFLIDASGSMGQDAYPGDATRNATKWEELGRVLPQALATFPANYAVGASFFNYDPTSGCRTRPAVPILPLDAAQLASFASAFGGQSPGGLRPTAAGWQFALSELTSWSPPSGYEHAPRFIVLITDGSPTVAADCSRSEDTPVTEADYQAWISTVQELGQAAGVGTFVVGLSGSENPRQAPYDPLYMLSRVAVAGGTTPPDCTPTSGTLANGSVNPRGTYCHLDTTENPDFGTALEQALGEIQVQVTPCSYVLSEYPSSECSNWYERVMIDWTASNQTPRIMTRASNSTCIDGQYYWLPAPSFTFCPAACSIVKGDPASRIQAAFGYPGS